jgi:glycerol-3-phosphate dehydrogenase
MQSNQDAADGARSSADSPRGAPLGVSPHARADAVEGLSHRRFDVLVVGGGIIGAAVAAHAARLGLAVALVDAGDFGGATSSASSKLIHGGLRYLRLGDVRLVREAHHERRTLTNIVAPHLVHRIPFLLPLYRAGPYRPAVVQGGIVYSGSLGHG